MRWLSAFRTILIVALAGGLSACAPVRVGPAPGPATEAALERAASPAALAARQFLGVVETVEPVAERECRRITRGLNCDFLIVVDDRPNQPPNAFQTVDRFNRPVLAFNLALIASVDNPDELAFIMSHEAAHHMLGHLDRTRQNAQAGAVIFSGIAAITGATADGVRNAEQLGAAVGARSYSKDFELEADRLGTIISARAGYDPVRGAEFFRRIPDPGNRFLGSHPPNAERIEIVRQTAAQL